MKGNEAILQLYAKILTLKPYVSVTDDVERGEYKNEDTGEIELRKSCYCFREVKNAPFKSIRISDHDPNLMRYSLANTEFKKLSDKDNTNISIEFISDDTQDKKEEIRDYNNLEKSFKVKAYLYDVNLLTKKDVDIIFDSIKSWLYDTNSESKPFKDPFSHSYKKAYTKIGKAVKLRTDYNLVPDGEQETNVENGVIISPDMKSIDLNCSKIERREYMFITYDNSISIDEHISKIMNLYKEKYILLEKFENVLRETVEKLIDYYLKKE